MTLHTSCPSNETLQLFVHGETPASDVTWLEEHVEQCASCLQTLSTLEADDFVIQALRDGGAIVDSINKYRNEELIDQMRGQRPPSTKAVHANSLDIQKLFTPAQTAEEIGRLGHYRIVNTLGQGGMGVVYRAEDMHLKRWVALKMIFAGPVVSEERQQRFRREAETLARLEHPNIVRIFEIGESDAKEGNSSAPYLVMELVEGGSLADRLAESPLSPRMAAELVSTLARAVHAAHERGIIHRDLKPANVLLTKEQIPKITDFGLAKYVPTEEFASHTGFATATGIIVGTPNYMSPEQASARRDLGLLVDVYALGAILYETLTGRPPFQAATALETLQQVCTQDPVAPRLLQSAIPRDLQTICLKCLDKEPHRRYGSALEVALDLDRFMRGESIRARPVSLWERSRKWIRRNPVGAALVAVIILSAVTVTVGTLLYQARLREEVQRAETNAQSADKQRQRADARYREARNAMRNMLGRLRKKNVAGIPQLKELQQQQLEDALAFYKGILKYEDDPNPEVRLDVALAYREVGDVYQLLGRDNEAGESLERAFKMLERLAREQPADLVYQAYLGGTLRNLGHWYLSRRQVKKAEEAFTRCVRLSEKLTKARPEHVEWRQSLAGGYVGLGVLHHGTKRSPARQYKKALDVYLQLAREHPTDWKIAAAAAETYVNLGLTYYQDRKNYTLQDAEQAFREASNLLEPVIRDHPAQLRQATSYASLHINWGLLMGAKKDWQAKLEHYTRALDTLNGVLKREPNYSEALFNLLPAHGGRAEALGLLKRYKEAAADWEHVVRLSGKSRHYRNMRPAFRTSWIDVLLRAGDHARAVTETETLLQEKKKSGAALYQAAAIHARAAGIVAKQSSLAETYALQAMTFLKQAHVADHFKNDKHRDQLKIDTDLEPIRNRSDFKLFVKAITSTKKNQK